VAGSLSGSSLSRNPSNLGSQVDSPSRSCNVISEGIVRPRVLYENIRLYSFFSRWLIYPDGRDRTRSPPIRRSSRQPYETATSPFNASTLRAVRSNELSFTQCPARPSLALTCTVPRQNPFPRLLVLVRNVLGVLTPLHVPNMRGRGKIFVSSRVVLSVPIQP